MKQYFKNLMLALCGSNPYQEELDQARDEYEKTAERVKQLDNLYYSALEKWDQASKLLSNEEALLEKAKREIKEKQGEVTSLQALVENLREHIAEKDAQIGQINDEHKKRVEGFQRRTADYRAHVAKLKAELEQAKRRNRQAREKQKAEKEAAAYGRQSPTQGE